MEFLFSKIPTKDRIQFFFSFRFLIFSSRLASHVLANKMSDRTNSKQTQFDNLSYIPDGRDRIGFSNNPQKSSSTNSNNRDLILQAKDLARTDTVYRYRTGHDSIYAYSNAAFRLSGFFSRFFQSKISFRFDLLFFQRRQST